MNSTLSRALAGAAAGVVATGAMTVEFAVAKSVGLLGEPPPRKLTRRVLTVLGLRPKSATSLNVTTAAMHVGYGAAAGVLFSLLPAAARTPKGGAVFGVAVWAASYMGWIPALGLMRRPSKDRFARPTSMVIAHVIYGSALGAAFQRIAPALERRTETGGTYPAPSAV